MPRLSLRATSALGRVLLIAAAILAVIAVVAVSSGLRRQPDRRVQIVTRAPEKVAAQDAAGCPITGDCELSSGVPENLTKAVQARFPQAVLQWHSTTGTKAIGPVRVVALFQLQHTSDTLFVNAECQPGSSYLADRRESSSADQRSDLAGNQIALLTIHEIMVSGAPGCTADLILNAVGDGRQYDSALQALSADPAIQVQL